jgi:ATP-dependent RNA helicase RhlE
MILYMSASASIPSNGFDQFELHEALVRGIQSAGFENPRPIQVETIPAGLDGRDVLGLAQTGTGKTAAFALPVLDQLLDVRAKGPRALVLAPTRELATQIADEIRVLSKFTRLKMLTIYGGVSMRGQINALKGHPEIIVGCPGRVLDLLNQGVLRLDWIETLVLDEADHMFDMGFLPDIRRILSAMPSDRQNLLFSATMPKEIRRLADDLLTDPHVVELADKTPASTIDHALYPVSEDRKRDLLDHLLEQDDCDSAIVFTRTKHRAKRLAEQLSKSGLRAVALQGNMSQSQRDRAMKGFRDQRFDILVATDIAARGIDVSGVSHVINFDVPNTPEAYTHRIGRTGRSELDGVACTFITVDDRAWVRATERMIGDPIRRHQVKGFEPDPNEKPQPAKSSQRNGSRGRSSRDDGGRGGRPDGQRPNNRRGSSGGRGRGRRHAG